MKNLLLALCLSLGFASLVPAFPALSQTPSASNFPALELLEQADALYEDGDREGAKLLYLQAAKLGSADGHFELTYKYILSDEERLYHLSEAAKLGHSEALSYVLDALVFRADSLRWANPQAALELFYQAQQVNPALELYDGEAKLRVLQMAAEPRGFDPEAFITRYKLDEAALEDDFYGIWQLAEEASRGGRFGKPDPELVLNLVIRGGSVPAETSAAISDAYANWKAGQAEPFNICDYVTSGSGMGFCAARSKQQDSQTRDNQLIQFKATLAPELHPLLEQAYADASSFIEAKAADEEGHGGTGRAAWILNSEMEQKNAWITMVKQVQSRKLIPSSPHDLATADRALNNSYKDATAFLARPDQPDYLPSPDELRAVQRLWLPYRDSTTRLLQALNPALDQQSLLGWMSNSRTAQLKLLLQ
ncbi:lysozyme inhibitor LprI family protein [Kiloniella laminariae]|uniref:lysozyme inhibitor LprI family protein n=1 Tax=Kiloniella laminariae TaxID=454162 RepID=UPI000380A08C|nr:lysozyme inhibitor LprI family protein [Kiloniella laminariae]